MSTESNVDAKTCCKCIKSKCLKRYCDCFASGVYCGESCSCKECFNLPVYENLVQESRAQIEKENPHAFSAKIQTLEVGDNLIPITQEKIRKGCSCKKTRCLHKYCECYKAKVGCWAQCQCEECRNAYGMKGTSRSLDEVLNTKLMSQDMTVEYLKSVKKKKPSYSPSPKAGSFYHDMMIGTSRMDSDDQLEVMNRSTSQDMNATHVKSMMNLSHSTSSESESCESYMMIESTRKECDIDEDEFVNQLIQSPDHDMMIGTSSRDCDIVHVDRVEFVFRSQFTPQEFNTRQDERKKTKK